ncbi:MAG: cytochrome c oxidase subunit 3 [Dehalococcoidia bacterium]|nr:cytochrome c oxidase subunit 3 [Dehalococcoidia bacterium]
MEHKEAHTTTTGIDNRKMMIWVFLGSECMFFGSLIATYLIYFGRSLSGPGLEILDIPTTSVSTFVLLMSSFMMVMAYSSIAKGDVKKFRVWIMCTAILGATFLGFQYYEFTEFAHHYHLTPQTNLFGTTFFTLTGFHGAHVTVGVIWLITLFGYSFYRKEDLIRDDALNVDFLALYWHFVDVVWIVIFTVVYLIGVRAAGVG